MAKQKLNFKFNNPNSVEDTTEMLLKLFIEATKPKVDEAIKKAAEEDEKAVSLTA